MFFPALATTATDAALRFAAGLLRDNFSEIGAVVLDRTMPVMDGQILGPLRAI